MASAAFDAVARLSPVGPAAGSARSATSEAAFDVPDAVATSPRSVIPFGGEKVAFVAEPKNATSIEAGAAATTDLAVIDLESCSSWLDHVSIGAEVSTPP